ncbi:MAG: S41 family peptidase [Candidimonas sp.]|nr:MAG: S41 family peptidase [Candidimonas sp.]
MSTRRFGKFGLVVLGAVAGVLLSLGITAAAQRDGPLPLKELQQFANVFAAIKSSYVEPMSDKTLIDDAIKGLFLDLDPHSTYLDPQAYKEMQAITEGGFGGLGIEIGSEDGMPKVIAPIEDTPAARAGIMAGDIIIAINGKPTKGMSLSDAVNLMRGEPKTSVELTIKRQGRDKPLVFKIVRDLIKVRSVRSKMLPGNIIYARIAQFQDGTASDLVKQLRLLSKDKAPRALILDLRNDPGGLLESAIGVASTFLKSGDLVVSTKGRIPSSNHQYYVRAVDYVNGAGARLPGDIQWARTVPMVVLVNVGSASASEIVAGALQDHKRATLIGNRTFGKGSVQSVLPLSEDTGIKLTTALYYTPSGRSIQLTGVVPNITVDDTAQGNLFRLPREVDLKHHLLNKEAAAQDLTDEMADKPKVEPKMFEFGGADDYQLREAVNFLDGRPVKRRNPSLVLGGAAQAKGKAKDAHQTAPAVNSSEKKTPLNGPEPRVEHYRVTPEGVIRVH